MKQLHASLTVILATALIVVLVLLNRGSSTASLATSDTARSSVASLERISAFEEAMESLGYKAWGFRWNGGMIDATIERGPDGPDAWSGVASLMLEDLSNLARSRADSFDQTSISGELLVLLGPLSDDSGTTDVPCRIAMTCRLPHGESLRRVSDSTVEFVETSTIEDEKSVQVFGKWKHNETGSQSGELTSLYHLIQLRWLPGGESQ